MNEPTMHGVDALGWAFRDEAMAAAVAFPGSPATSLAMRLDQMDDFDLRWAVNENDVLSFAFGHVLAGRGCVAIMKHVGVNVALDALQVMGVVHGLPAPLVLVEGADARPGSSQSAQDNRPVLAGSMDVLVLAPTGVQEVYELTRTAVAISRALGMLVVIRGDARMFKTVGALERRPMCQASLAPPWSRKGHGMSVTAASYELHLRARRRVHRALSGWIERLVEPFEALKACDASMGVLVAGHLGTTIAKQVAKAGFSGLRLLSEHPLPEQALQRFCTAHDRIVVLEECLPVLEDRLRVLVQRHGLATKVLGRAEIGDERRIGWLEGDSLTNVLEVLVEHARDRPGSSPRPAVLVQDDDTKSMSLPTHKLPTEQERNAWDALGRELADEFAQHCRTHPQRGFTATDPRKPLFELLRDLGGERLTFVATDPGITGLFALGDGKSDVKMHMGGAVPLAAGFSRARRRDEALSIAVVGDTNLFHSEWLGLLESAAAQDDMLVVVVDNGFSEMTAKLRPLRPTVERAVASLTALGITTARVRGSLDRQDDWATTLRELSETTGLRLCWIEI